MPKSPEAKARQAEYLREYRKSYKADHRRITITFTPEEYERIAQEAKAQNQPVATYLHDLTLSALDHIPILSLEDEEKARTFVHLIRGIANNLNQMARYSHTMRGTLDEREIGYQLQYMEEAYRKFLEGRGGKGS
jgi:hypothetical protein